MSYYLFTADWHLRSDIPRSVKINPERWIDAQLQVLAEINRIAEQKHCQAIVVAGDVFNSYDEGQTLVNRVINEIKGWRIPIYLIGGNHDLPYHSFQNLWGSSLGLLINSKAQVCLLDNGIPSCKIAGASFGAEDKFKLYLKQPSKLSYAVGVVHRLVAPPKTFPPEAGIPEPADIFNEFPAIPLLVVGDYHHCFMAREGSRRMLVPGCINKQSIDMKEYSPCVWIYDTEEGIMESERLTDVWDLEREESETKKESLLGAFVSLKGNVFNYRDRVLASENLQTLSTKQQELVHTIIQRSSV